MHSNIFLCKIDSVPKIFITLLARKSTHIIPKMILRRRPEKRHEEEEDSELERMRKKRAQEDEEEEIDRSKS